MGLITVAMGYFAKDVEMSYDFSKAVPKNHPDMVFFEQFKEQFGEDGTMVALGVMDSGLFEVENFKKYKDLSYKLEGIHGVTEVISLPLIPRMEKNDEEKKFILEPIIKDIPDSQEELDSLFIEISNQKFFANQLINFNNGAVLLLVGLDKNIINSQGRIELTKNIEKAGNEFEESTGIDIKFAGLPFVRSIIAGNVAAELKIFLILSILVTGFIMLLFFRSWDAVIFPMIIIGVVVVWVLGSTVLFGYKITMLTGLIPPLIVVIGIPNSVYLLNMYHREFELHGNKVKAISRVTRKIGLVTLITNFTTAIGFLVLVSTDIVILRQFGIIAGLNIMATFLVSII
ncbi:MAG: MMPL family transporter, partial [Cyclobacteriaceae bacterium]|nr:MMPL family transporter [Cyclobacteriaceae bacterium]